MKKIIIDLNLVSWIFVSIIMLKPESLSFFGWNLLDTTLDILKIFVALILFLRYLFDKKKDFFIIFATAFKLFVVIMSIINKTDIFLSINYFVTVFVFTYMIMVGRSNFNVVKALYIVLNIFGFINIMTLLLFPKGIYQSQAIGFESNWFLGYKTILPIYIIPQALISFLFYERTKKNKHIVCFLLLAITQTLLERSGGAIVAVAILCLGFSVAVFNWNRLNKIFNLKWIYIGYLVLSYLLIVVQITMKYAFNFIELLGKDRTLTTRVTRLWPLNVAAFLKKPVCGWGMLGGNSFQRIAQSHRAHNIALGILVAGGIIGITIYTIFILYLHWSTKMYVGTREYTLVTVCILAFFVAGLTESFEHILATNIIFPVLYYLPDYFGLDRKLTS